MDHLEIELKFFVSDFSPIRQRLLELGADCIAPKALEFNIRYETADDGLIKNQRLLRLRKDRETTLTFKAPPSKEDTRFKTYRELEVKVDDFDTLDQILRALGFQRRQVYEKWRETWRLDEAVLCMDTMPFGRFLEIEGSPETITTMVRQLGLSWNRRILDNYLGMFQRLQGEENLAFTDLTFDNFNQVAIDFNRYLHLFEVG